MGVGVNIRKIAELSGCSPSTVSRVLSEKKTDIKISAETRGRIDKVCRELDYQPSVHAARFFSKKARCVGFLPSRECFVLDDNLARSMNAVFQELNRLGYRCLPLINDARFMDGREYLKLFKGREIDALIVWGAAGDGAYLAELEERCLPFMLLTNRLGSYPAVSCDNRAGVAAMVQRCRERGARRFVYLNIPKGDCCEQRRAAFWEELGDAQGEAFDVGMTIEDGAGAAAAVMRSRPDAVVCGNDRLAFGLEQALLAAGVRVPDELLITGADDIELARYAPAPLTTFDQMAEECAVLCVQTLVGHLERGEPLRSAVLPPRIRLRQSA